MSKDVTKELIQPRVVQPALPGFRSHSLRKSVGYTAFEPGPKFTPQTGEKKAYYPHYTQVYEQISFSDDNFWSILAIYDYADVWAEFPDVRKEGEA